MHSAGDVRTQWLAQLFCTDPADRAGAEAAVRGLCEEAGLAPPRHACWFDSPFDAAWAVALLIEEHHRVWRDLLGGARKRRSERDRMDRVAAALCAQCGVASLAAARETIGPPVGMALQSSGAPTGLQPAILSARMGMHDDVSALFVAPTEADDLYRAESRFWGGNLGALISGVLCPTAGTAPRSCTATGRTCSRGAAWRCHRPGSWHPKRSPLPRSKGSTPRFGSG